MTERVLRQRCLRSVALARCIVLCLIDGVRAVLLELVVTCGAFRTPSKYWGAQQHRTLGAPSDRKVPRRFASRLVR